MSGLTKSMSLMDLKLMCRYKKNQVLVQCPCLYHGSFGQSKPITNRFSYSFLLYVKNDVVIKEQGILNIFTSL